MIHTLSEALTDGVRVRVVSQYLPERSRPEADHYFFVYTVRIGNEGAGPVQLLSRHWIIRDGDGREQHVKGPGVVGAQPNLKPGEAFEYTSFCPLPTPTGSMRGTYQMVRPDGEAFDAVVAPFLLSRDEAWN